jgi:hypothetical protein
LLLPLLVVVRTALDQVQHWHPSNSMQQRQRQSAAAQQVVTARAAGPLCPMLH